MILVTPRRNNVGADAWLPSAEGVVCKGTRSLFTSHNLLLGGFEQGIGGLGLGLGLGFQS